MKSQNLKLNQKNGHRKYITAEGQEVMNASLKSKYYCLNTEVVRAKHQTNATAQIMHARFGCLNKEYLERLEKEDLVDGFKMHGELSEKCHVCIEGKQTRQPFKTSKSPRAKHPMDLIHVDILVINLPSRDEELYALIMVDDHSDMKFAFPMRKKSDVTDMVKNWIPWAERMTNRKFKDDSHRPRQSL